jgi:amino acid permease
MERYHKMPLIMGITAAIVAGIISYLQNTNDQAVYLRMAVSMAVFYFIGVYAKSTLNKIHEELDRKKEEEERKEEEELRIKKAEEAKELGESGSNNSRVDFRVGEDNEFMPFTVGEVIRTKLDEDK